jgi:tetratricopeptide (TPR) repeat protein
MALHDLGPYRVLERLGAGANGEVFLAEDTRLRRQVAIKTLSGRGGSDTAALRRRVLREGRAAARLNHPHIAAVYDVLEFEDGVHIVMEYVRGTTLAARLRGGRLPPLEALDLGVQLSAALAHAHSMGVVHRDLKPGNIVITPEGQAKILDFGLARLTELEASTGASTDASVERKIVGTPPYIPPEHFRGEPVDARGDIYSLGVTLFEMLTGRRPFEARDGLPLTTAVLSSPTPRPRSLAPDVPADLDAIVFRAIAREPEERYRSAAELESELRRLASGILDSPTVSRTSEASPPARASRSVARWAVAAVLVAGAGLYGAAWKGCLGRSPAAPAAAAVRPVVAVLPLSGASGDADSESLAAGVADAVITSLARVPSLTVVSRSATLKHRAREADVSQIARELGATLIVDGSVQRSGQNLMVTVSVVEPGSNVIRWRNSYDGTFAEVFTLQKEVANAVAGALRVSAAPVDAGGPTQNMDAFAEYAQARSFLERPDVKDNLDRSLVLFRAAVAKDPGFARAHAGLGEALWRKFEATREQEWATLARDEITEALRLDPNDTSVRQSLASLYRGLGRYDQAIDELRKITAAQPASDEAHRLLGQILFDRGHLDEGVAEIREAIRLRPQYWAHHATLGQVFYRAGRFQDAIPSFRRVTELQPDSAWGYQMMGAAYHSLDDTANAIAPYQRAIALGNAKAHGNLGLVYFDMGRLEDALREWQEAARLEPESIRNHHNVAEALSLLGRTRDARPEYVRAAELCQQQLHVRANDAGTLSMLALVETRLGQAASADEHVARAVALAPDDAEVRYAEAVVNVRRGRVEPALAALRAAVAAGYSPLRAGRDPAFAPLKTHPSYAAALAVAKAHGG